MKTLWYFLMVCLFALFVIPKKEQQKPPRATSQQFAEIKQLNLEQSMKLDSLKEFKKLDTLIEKIERNNEYLKTKQKN